jgi:hypothetical protein
MKCTSAVSVFILGLACLPVIAQGWKETTVSDPMSNKVYIVFTLSGNGVGENLLARISLSCLDRKFLVAQLTVQGMAFHYDSATEYPLGDPRLRPSVTRLAIRLRDKIDYTNSFLSPDFQTAEFRHGDIKKMLDIDNVVIEFSDAFATVHHVRFDGMLPVSDMATECGIKAEEEKQK